MAMLNEIIYSAPSFLKPLLRKIVVSILDWDIVYLCQMDKLGPSYLLGSLMYKLFSLAGWLINNFGLPRLTPYKRTFLVNEKDNVSHRSCLALTEC